MSKININFLKRYFICTFRGHYAKKGIPEYYDKKNKPHGRMYCKICKKTPLLCTDNIQNWNGFNFV